MLHLIDGDRDGLWKTQLRDQVMNNLEIMLQDVRTTYQRQVSDNVTATPDDRYRLELEYKRDLKNLRYLAEEDLRAKIKWEEQERRSTAEAQWHRPDDVDHAIIEEQVAILAQIRSRQSGRVHPVVVQEYNGAVFQQGSSSKPFYEPKSPLKESKGTAGAANGYFAPHPVCVVNVESPIEIEARLRAEKQQKQQEDFRQRAEAIQNRKRRERQWTHQLQWTESMSSSSSMTSASDQEPTTPLENVAKPEIMSEEDVVNLIIFHDQQWIFISSLPHLQWSDFPWPVLSFSSPKRKEELTLEAVVEYIFAPLTVNRDRAVVKDRLKDLIRRWHPDRFDTKYLALIADLREREMVREGAGVVARILNDLLGKWNDL